MTNQYFPLPYSEPETNLINNYEFYSQKNSEYADCAPIVVANACVFYDMDHPKPNSEEWEEIIDLCSCRYGAAIASTKIIANYFKLSALKIDYRSIYGHAPILITVKNPEVGHDLHCVLIVGWINNMAITLNYRCNGPLMELLPVSFLDPPKKRGPKWNNMYIVKLL